MQSTANSLLAKPAAEGLANSHLASSIRWRIMLSCLSQGSALRDHPQSSKIATAGGGLLTQGASLDVRDSGISYRSM
jgi:hypothetical protein